MKSAMMGDYGDHLFEIVVRRYLIQQTTIPLDTTINMHVQLGERGLGHCLIPLAANYFLQEQWTGHVEIPFSLDSHSTNTFLTGKGESGDPHAWE